MESENTQILKCTACGAKNRIPIDKINSDPKCGKCHAPIQVRAGKDLGFFKPRCTECWTHNKVPIDKINEPAKCGKCGTLLKIQGLLTTTPVTVSDADFAERILKSPLPVLLFAWAPWCPTCRSFLPVVDSFAADSQGKVRVAKINVDASPRISSEYAIMSVPRIFIFEKGQLKEELPGALQKHEMMMKMMHYIQ